MAKYKIWWQSTMREGAYPEYTNAVEEHAKKFLSDDFELESHGVKNGTDNVNKLAGKYFNDREILKYMLEAKERKFDAIALGCFQDPVINEIKEMMDIPVFGMCQTSMQWSQLYGTAPAILHYSSDYVNKLQPRLMHQYGMENKLVKTKPFDVTFDFLMEGLLGNPDKAIDMSLKAAKEAVDNGADIILPGCGLLNLILARNGVTEVPGTGVSIVDVTALLLKVTEIGVFLSENTGLKRSNFGFFEKLSDEAIEEIKERYNL